MSDDKWLRVRLSWRWRDKAGTYEDPVGKGTAWRDEETGEPNFFMWEEGNYSCDCNKAVLFGLDEDESYAAEQPCGEEIEISNLGVIDE
jgi:hypothetical protein